ncbi:MAG TPA: hypothetical protein VLB46_06095 [Pyrinomonadaceae bacterium]|nr:hypothetical protein [Pyrinomonadaceae bacterium]
MRITLLCLLTLLTLAPAAAQRASTPPKQTTDTAQYIGLRYGPTLPRGLKSTGGSLVSAVEDEKEYAMSEIRRGRIRMLWFDRLTHRDDNGIAYWEVKDVLVLPAIPNSQILVYAMCLLNDKPDSEIAAIADHQPTEQYFTRVRKAWRANRTTEKFEPMPVKGIKCENPAAGL